MNYIADEQARHNRQSRDAWHAATNHRRRVMQLLLDKAGPKKHVAILGAGNCNDIDLNELASAFGQITLIDIDREAVAAGVERQLNKDDRLAKKQICISEPRDLTGIGDLLSRLQHSNPSDQAAMVDAILARLADPSLDPPSIPFDVVASLGLLSQLIHPVTQLLAHQPSMLSVIQLIRRQHILQCLGMVRAGGTCLLIIDFVSTATAPELLTVAESQLPALARTLINNRNFFSGLNPAQIRQILLTDDAIATQIANLQITGPWLWDLGPRHYAVYAFQFRRAGADR